LRWEDYPIGTDSSEDIPVIAAKAFEGVDNPTYKWLKSIDNLKDELERQRLIYIGATRAIRRLYISGCMQIKGEKLQVSERENLLIEKFYVASEKMGTPFQHQPYDEIQIETSAGKKIKTDTPQEVRDLEYLPDSWRIALPDDADRKTREQAPEMQSSIDAVPVFDLAQHLQTLIGTAVHRALQEIANDDVKQWHADRVTKHMDNWTSYLHQLGTPQDKLKECAQKVCEHLQRTLKDEKGRWLLEAHSNAATELRLFSTDTQTEQISLLIVDRTFVLNGERWIVDYKSSHIHDGEPETHFLRRQEQQHTAQLAKYAKALENLGKENVRTALYFTALPKLHEYRL
jgi:ATP-dependent exoDNAse (exonuclease V) beta subunit